MNCLKFQREQKLQRFEATLEAEDTWLEEMKTLADATLFPLADSWYMGANIPGKPRQLLNHPHTPTYMEYCDRCASNGYEEFELS
ncbi:MAG: hypothetical protein V7754_09010 [Halioglobus sp.]